MGSHLPKRLKKPFIKNIKSEIGSKILHGYLDNGWSIVDQYDETMFDKGVDYDFYEISDGKRWILFVWDNWCEWEMASNSKMCVDFISELTEWLSAQQVDAPEPAPDAGPA